MEIKKGNKKYGKKGSEGHIKIDTKSPVLFASGKIAREMIRKRNNEIDRLNEIIDRLTSENIKIKEELSLR